MSSKDCLSLLGLLFELSLSGGLLIPAVVCCTVFDWYVVFCCLLAKCVPYASFVVDADNLDGDDEVGVDVDLAFCSVDCFLKNYHCL